jgi:hypothetical protein
VKSVDPSSMTDLFNETAVTMCMLERVFPPAFFDVMTHLPYSFGTTVRHLRTSAHPVDVSNGTVPENFEMICASSKQS